MGLTKFIKGGTQMNKHLLAALHPDPIKKLHQTQAVCYLSLLLNIICVVSILMMIFKR